MQCESCQHTERTKSEKLNQWLGDRGLIVCSELSKMAGVPIVTSSINVGGPVCGGKHYRAIEQTELF